MLKHSYLTTMPCTDYSQFSHQQDRQLTFDQDARKIDLADNKAAYKGGSPRYKNNNFTDLGGFGSDGTSGKEFF